MAKELSVAVVLGCWTLPFKILPEITRERVDKAIELLNKGRVQKILFTGGVPKPRIPGTKTTEAGAMKKYAIKRGVDPKAIAPLEDKSKTTFHNLEYSIPILERLGATEAVIVTHDFHRPRSLLYAEERLGMGRKFKLGYEDVHIKGEPGPLLKRAIKTELIKYRKELGLTEKPKKPRRMGRLIRKTPKK